MPQHPAADPFCPYCRGVGSVFSDEKIINGEYWCSFMDCICLPDPPPLSPRIKAIVERALAGTR